MNYNNYIQKSNEKLIIAVFKIRIYSPQLLSNLNLEYEKASSLSAQTALMAICKNAKVLL